MATIKINQGKEIQIKRTKLDQIVSCQAFARRFLERKRYLEIGTSEIQFYPIIA